jgi:hypothetical protein
MILKRSHQNKKTGLATQLSSMMTSFKNLNSFNETILLKNATLSKKKWFLKEI